MVDLLEALMIIAFGVSWPVAIYKSLVSKTAKGKSLGFEIFIWLGYIFGITRKIIQLSQGGEFSGLFWLGFVFYILNLAEISFDIILYFRNRRYDKLAEAV
ncbi:MAG: hypothetical protein K6B15_09995 [Parasporobacterium sp.]|nr:hypothetical protein [Parasporobacterium sp.]